MRLFKIDSTSENTRRENYLFKLAITAHIYVVLSAKYFSSFKMFYLQKQSQAVGWLSFITGIKYKEH